MIKKTSIYLPKSLKADLDTMSVETGIPKTQIGLIALHSLIANYEVKNNSIFAELLNSKIDKEKEGPLLISIPNELKNKLENLSNISSISQSQLVVLALYALIENYKKKKSGVFFGLLNK
ncbi:MAG: hypothetical protein ACH0QD_13525 [Tepidibacillus sp.]